MSIFSSIKAAFTGVESDVAKFATAFEKIFKKAPAAIQVVDNFVNEAAPIITAAVAVADPAAEPAVVAGLVTAETLLAAIKASADAANSGQSLLANLENFATTVPSLLSGLDIKNAALKATVERFVALVVGEAKVLIPAVQGWVAQASSAK